ncbi:MAG: zinc-binding metallopeptidase family protein [Candidatus Binatia bacterium]
MKIFHCDHCRQLVFFENARCVNCSHPLAYLPDLGVVGSLDAAGGDLWRSPIPRAQGLTYRLCVNYSQENVCNWAVSADDPQPLCKSCRLTRVIPNLSRPGHKEAWYRLEVAKRRLVYNLLSLALPLANKFEDPEHGLTYEFLAEADMPGGAPVLTGHSNGVITINVAEANDAEREKQRRQLHEPYRTLLGHFRHEVGHYYWDRLIKNSEQLAAFRQLFGDERENYEEALKRHYQHGASDDWQQRFISIYASAHPWEDWAETWAHYLHMTDTLETAVACGVSLSPRRADEPSLKIDARSNPAHAFDRMINDWFSLTYMLNNLNRGMGLPDGYPFLLPTPAIDKLRFVHETIIGP